jgi:hypothetical protein
VAADGGAGAAASWRRAILPAEHGGWAFLAEPLLLGLLVGFSPAGALIALGAILAFLARQPLRTFVADRSRGRSYPRTATAARAFAACALAGAAVLAGAVLLGGGAALVPLALASPLAAVSLTLDFGRRSREAAAEVCAALALGAAAPAIVVAAGAPLPVALALWGVLAARSVPTILYVRARLRRARGVSAGAATPMAAHVAGVAWNAALAGPGLTPWTPRRPRRRC